MAGKHKLVELAEAMRSLAVVPAEVARDVVPEINQQILEMGKPGGPLRGGNAVKAHVEASGTTIRIVGVFPEAGVRRSWLAAIERIVGEAVRKRLR